MFFPYCNEMKGVRITIEKFQSFVAETCWQKYHFWKQLELSLVKGSHGLFNHRIGVDLDKTEIEFGKFALHRMVVDPKKIWTCLNFRGLLKNLLTIKITHNQSTKANLCWNFKGKVTVRTIEFFRQVISSFLVSQTVIVCIIENFHLLGF